MNKSYEVNQVYFIFIFIYIYIYTYIYIYIYINIYPFFGHNKVKNKLVTGLEINGKSFCAGNMEM